MAKLAINGGPKLRKKPFPDWPQPNTRMLKEVTKVLKSGKWGIGSPAVAEFEKKFAELHNAKHALMVANGTVSLWVALKACGLKAGDEVIIPPYTFMATAVAVVLANGKPVFVDVDPETFNIDPKQIEAAITDRTKVIMPVHIGGMPSNMDAIKKIAKKHRLRIIEDAAQAHMAEWKGRRIGAIGDIGSFSFQSSKNMSGGEGGMVVSDNQELIDLCFTFSNCGRVRSGRWYEHRHMGANYRPNAFAAAVLNAQVETVVADTQKREKMGRYLDSRLAEIPGLKPQKRLKQVTMHGYHLYIFSYDSSAFDGVHRNDFLRALNAEGIDCGTGYVPLYKEGFMQLDPAEYPWAAGAKYGDIRLPGCEKVCNETGCWLYQSTLLADEKDMDDIANAMKKVRDNLPELKSAVVKKK
ncbi:MAG TPA: DegT/DnrJ/EryC1/StrS family aminotransferase [Candidatus Brocadiia bacterium]|nr:DegT/DnrJ/EryC1/StrS family aminotransferase [Candidatus Brocadiia bacterium]